MGAIWLACCACEAYARVQREVEARDSGARILRVGSASMLSEMAEAFARDEAPVSVIVDCPAPDALLEAVGTVGSVGAADQVVAMAARVDAALAARLFRAGATEVIAGAETDPLHSGGEVRAETERAEGADVRRGSRDGVGAALRRATAEAVPQATSALCAPAIRDAGSGGYPADDLDEPDGIGAATCGGRPAGVVGARRRGVARDGAGAVDSGGRAPLIALVSGRGGCGKTTLAAAIALRASALGLRCAVLDLDLMFGNLHALLGADEPRDAATLIVPSGRGALTEAEVVRASMRIAPGLTVWGPVAVPEKAELMGAAVEQLIRVVRGEADLVVADTPVSWGDAAAAAVAACDRCLVVGDARVGSIPAAERVIALAGRIGVSRTKMASVFNRFSGRDGGEDAATRFEFSTALGLKVRIGDGGAELEGLAAVGHLDEALARQGAFRSSLCSFADRMFRELGCPVPDQGPSSAPHGDGARPRIRLPWGHAGGAVS